MNNFDSEAVLISGSSGFDPGNPETGGAQQLPADASALAKDKPW